MEQKIINIFTLKKVITKWDSFQCNNRRKSTIAKRMYFSFRSILFVYRFRVLFADFNHEKKKKAVKMSEKHLMK